MSTMPVNPQVRRWAPLVLSGAIFVLTFYLGYSGLPPVYYAARDDGIITLSHVRNLVEFGTIGVNPSGERVEAFSTPLQFLLYLAAYPVVGEDYGLYLAAQTYLCAFLVGVLFYATLCLINEKRRYVHLILTAGAAVFLSRSYSFFEWHGSGMENPLTHVTLLATLYGLTRMMRDGRVRYGWAGVILIASISRIEAIYHIGPMVTLFAVLWYRRHRNLSGLFVLLVFLALWGLFNGLRYLYFGQLFPNTAAANNVLLGNRIDRLLSLEWPFIEKFGKMAFQAFVRLNGVLLLFSLPLLAVPRPSRAVVPLLLFVGLLVASSFAFFLIFGEPRLDAARPVSFLPLIFALLMAALAVQPRDVRHWLWAAPLVLAGGITASVTGASDPYHLCCPTTSFAKVRGVFQRLARKHRIHRATVACPDLGYISWHKDFNIVDLGWLGSPVLAKLKHNAHPSTHREYILEFAQPDFLHIHGGWQTVHRRTMKDPRFKHKYKNAVIKHKSRKRTLREVWVRKDIALDAQTDERRLLNTLQERFSVTPIEKSLQACTVRPGKYDCLYVTRTVYRFLDRLASTGHLPRLRALFAKTQTARYDLALLGSRENGSWAQEVMDALVTLQR